MKCPKCNGDRVVTCLSTVTEFYPDGESAAECGIEDGDLDAIESEYGVRVGMYHCVDCGHDQFWLEDPRNRVEDELAHVRAENARMQNVLLLVAAHNAGAELTDAGKEIVRGALADLCQIGLIQDEMTAEERLSNALRNFCEYDQEGSTEGEWLTVHVHPWHLRSARKLLGM